MCKLEDRGKEALYNEADRKIKNGKHKRKRRGKEKRRSCIHPT